MKIATAEPASGDVLAYLLENADPDYLDELELTAEAVRCITVRDGETLVFACAYMVQDRAHGREVEILTANGSRAKAAKWIAPTIELVDEVAREIGANRILVPVTRPALSRVLQALRFSPFTSILMRAVS